VKIITIPAGAGICCCGPAPEPPGDYDCDCDCATMPSSVTVEFASTTCDMGFNFKGTGSGSCTFYYTRPDPDPCFDNGEQIQVNEVWLICEDTDKSRWRMFVGGDGNTGSLGGGVNVPVTSTGCPASGEYDVDLTDPQDDIIITVKVTIP
jgi:hypothetical protein